MLVPAHIEIHMESCLFVYSSTIYIYDTLSWALHISYLWSSQDAVLEGSCLCRQQAAH